MGRRITGHNIICAAPCICIEMMPTYFRKLKKMLESMCVFLNRPFLLLSWILNFVAFLPFVFERYFSLAKLCSFFSATKQQSLGLWRARVRRQGAHVSVQKVEQLCGGIKKIIPSISAKTLRRVLWKRGKRARGLNRSHQADFSFTDHHIFLWNFQYCQVLFVSYLSMRGSW